MRIAPQALPIAAVLGAVALVAGLLGSALAALPPLLLLLFTLWFFRDPERVVAAEPGALLSPADGRVIKAGPRSVSIFMSVFDVHVCRAPMAGRVESVEHQRGRFLAAYRDAASEHNERLAIRLVDGPRGLDLTLVAGLVARRIVCGLRPGQHVAAGQRIGLIQFGSRVDVELPERAAVDVRLKQRVLAGQTVIGRLAGPDR